MSSVSLFIIIMIYIIFVIISMFINDTSLKVIYWFIIVLGTLTIINLYISISYYISLRNEVGKPGPRGRKGEKGPRGHTGKCTFSKKCGIDKCDNKIMNIIKDVYPDISAECIKNPDECDSGTGFELAQPVNKLYNKLLKKCKKTTIPEEEFLRKIRPQIEFLTTTTPQN